MSAARKYLTIEEVRKLVTSAPSISKEGLNVGGQRIIFADESSYNKGRFRGLCLVSLAADDLERVEEQITSLPHFDQIREFKWEKVRSDHSVEVATSLLMLALRLSSSHRIEIDPIVWDAHDPANQKARTELADVYAQAIRNVLLRHDGFQIEWNLFPDEMLGMDWAMLRKRLNDSALDIQPDEGSIGGVRYRSRIVRRVHDFMIRKVTPCTSSENPVVWIADLMAGMSRLMHEQIFDAASPRCWLKDTLSHSERARSRLLQHALSVGVNYSPIPYGSTERLSTAPRFRVYDPTGF